MATARPSVRDRKKDETRQRIEDAAWELFSSQGFEDTTVQQIVEQAGVAPRTFFRYFPSKEAVLYPELDGFMATMAEAFRTRPSDEPALVALLNAMDTVNEQLMGDAGRQFERYEMLRRTGAGITSSFVRDRISTAVANMIRERFADEADVDVRAQLTAGLVSTVMTISTEEWLSKGGSGDVDDEARRCFDILRSLIG